MAVKEATGRLIAVDGTRGKDIVREARALAAELKHRGVACAISHWDASGLFAELALGKHQRGISARTLSLVYAADLAFRLRWEIVPQLEEGGTVIAAPYIETAVAFGLGSGLGSDWVRELLRFAPPADVRSRAVERKTDKAWKQTLGRGYLEYCAVMLAKSAPKLVSKSTRKQMITALHSAPAGKSIVLTEKGLAAAAKAATTGSPKAASSR